MMGRNKKRDLKRDAGNSFRKTSSQILVAEDDRVTLSLLERKLGEWGYEVLKARDGWQAWEMLKKSKLRIAILDWMMPGFKGPELCRWLRQLKKPHYTYLILLTSRDSVGDLIEGLEAGADDYMTKPINLMELKARLKTARRIIELENNLIEAQRRLSRLAITDSLTGVWNRRKFLHLLNEELNCSQREGRFLGLLMMDLDNFKEINDLYGHPAGDAVLKQLAQLVRRNLRKYDQIARYGGDEFILLLPGCDLNGTGSIAERLLDLIRRNKFRRGTCQAAAVSVSFGGTAACPAPEQGVDSDSLIRTADRALYWAKRDGRDRVVIIGHEGEK